jgi:hypothetical protein
MWKALLRQCPDFFGVAFNYQLSTINFFGSGPKRHTHENSEAVLSDIIRFFPTLRLEINHLH